jgi:hypothetical protein
MNVTTALKNPLALAVAAVVVIGAVYFFGKKTIVAVADTAGGVVSGNNAVTRGQTNAAGEETDAYVGRGILGTLGAAANSASGGALASAGEALSGWLHDLTDVDYIN